MKNLLAIAVLVASAGTVYSQVAIACVGVPNGQFVRNSASCAHWHWCNNGVVAGSGSCDPIFNFDALMSTCRYSDVVDCATCSLFGQQNIQSMTGCDKFIRCTNGVGVLMSCPSGLLFNPETGHCDVGVICNIPEPTTTPLPTTTTEATTITHSESTTTTPELTTIPINGTTEAPGTTPMPDIDCSGTQVHHAHPTNCTQFFLCINNQAVLMQCPDGLYWNQFVVACDRPENTVCVQGEEGEAVNDIALDVYGIVDE